VDIYVLSPKLLLWNFLQISQLSIRSGALNFLLILGLFAIIDHNLVKIVAPPGDRNRNSQVHLKEQSLLKKGEHRVKIYP